MLLLLSCSIFYNYSLNKLPPNVHFQFELICTSALLHQRRFDANHINEESFIGN